MTYTSETPFTHSHVLLEDGAVAFKCATDIAQWPWLKLPPGHPILIQTINYWGSVETGNTAGTFNPKKRSALTFSKWWCGEADVGPVTHGLADTAENPDDPDRPYFRLTFFDADGALVCRLVGVGVVFHNRDFEGWRAKAKEKVAPHVEPVSFQYASRERLGVSSDVERFLGPLIPGEQPKAQALVTKENSLPPNHPWHDGSGDHVNANHLADVGYQFAHLLHEGAPLRCRGGDIRFKHFVELGRPFTVTSTGLSASKRQVSLVIHQGERLCTEMTLDVEVP